MTKNNSILPQPSATPARSKLHWWLLLLGIALALAGGAYFAEVLPRFIDLSIPPPDEYEGGLSGDWMSESRSILILPPSAVPDLRVFILRKETMVSYDEAHSITSWESLVEYFDEKLDQLGWVRSETYAPCQIYLPEANFLPENAHNGYVYYRRREYKAHFDLEQSDVICLAVWKSSPTLFNIVLISAQPSYFTILNHLLF